MFLNLPSWCRLRCKPEGLPAGTRWPHRLGAGTCAAALLAGMVGGLAAHADPAHFWISTSNLAPGGPQSPAIDGVLGSVRYLHIWAQPATTGSGEFNSDTNPFQVLQNFSLDVITESAPAIEFLDQILVYNPESGGRRRYSYVNDSSTLLKSETSVPDQIYKIQGYTIFANQATGFGGKECAAGDNYCSLTSNNQPSWLVASLAYRVAATEGTANLFLQLGVTGMNHLNAESQEAVVTFGALPSPAYNGSTGRQRHNGLNETPDLMLTAKAMPTPVQANTGGGSWSDPANWDGGVVPGWDSNVTLGAELAGQLVEIHGSQRANLTTVRGGRLAIGEDASLASEVVVSEMGSVGGPGWIDSNLTLRGSLAIESGWPLRISGVADVANGKISLLGTFLQSPNTTANVTVLQANGGVQGRLLEPALGSQLRPGVFFAGVDYVPAAAPTAIVLKLRTADTGLPGDYNANGTLDAADYIVWRNGGPLRNEAQTIGVVGNDDYTYWRSRFNSQLSHLSGDYNNNGSVDAADYILWRKGWLLYNESLTPRNNDAEDYAEWRLKFGSALTGTSAHFGAAAAGEFGDRLVPEADAVGLLATLLGLLGGLYRVTPMARGEA